MANNLIVELKTAVGLSAEQIQQGIMMRAGNEAENFDDLQYWLSGLSSVPIWANKAAALWVIELWMQDRDGCQADSLLAVDKKYSRMLRGFSMAEIISMRYQIESK